MSYEIKVHWTCDRCKQQTQVIFESNERLEYPARWANRDSKHLCPSCIEALDAWLRSGAPK